MTIEKYIAAITSIDLFRDFTKQELLNIFKINKYTPKWATPTTQ